MNDALDHNAIKRISLAPAVSPHKSCDAWGCIRSEPVGTVFERIIEDYVKIFIYCVDAGYYYGYHIKIGTMLRQKAANINDRKFGNADLARVAASIEVENICNTNKNVKKVFADFIRVRYNQGSLFEEVDDE
ncbi:MAG: hypothetical protein FWC97_00420 [Treponema sp.]|nr:hypothetical protein [Treponema sp.]